MFFLLGMGQPPYFRRSFRRPTVTDSAVKLMHEPFRAACDWPINWSRIGEGPERKLPSTEQMIHGHKSL